MLPLVRQLLGAGLGATFPVSGRPDTVAALTEAARKCPVCKVGVMIVVEIPRAAAAPALPVPEDSS